jgi:nucleotide-binding universal stress UspA family protein
MELIAGHPAEVVATVAEIRHADEIIIGTRGYGRLRGAIGSVAHALLHEAKCPITVIPERALEAAAEGDRVQTGAVS